MILIIDNYDSFTYNLVQYIGELHDTVKVVRNDKITIQEVIDLKPSHVILSPGPCTPSEAGICVDLIRSIPETIPLLGVCLGHQSIGQAFGATIIRAPQIMHGKTSEIKHTESTLFKNAPSPLTATRYHSLIIDENTLPNCLIVTARSNDGVIMGVEHKNRPIYGIQFHPESIMTPDGKLLLKNFIETTV